MGGVTYASHSEFWTLPLILSTSTFLLLWHTCYNFPIGIVHCSMCTLDIIFSLRLSEVRLMSHISIVILFNIFSSQLIQLRGKRFREPQLLNLPFCVNYIPVATTEVKISPYINYGGIHPIHPLTRTREDTYPPCTLKNIPPYRTDILFATGGS